MKKLAIVVTHPIQYYTPVFQLLAKQCHLKVFYTWGDNWLKNKFDPGFGKNVEWDIPLLNGYEYEFVENTAKQPGSHHGKGIINPNIITKIAGFRPNAILIYGYTYHSHFGVMKHFKGKIPVWFRGDSTLLDKESPLKSILKECYLKWVYSYVDKAFYVGTNNKAYFKKYGLIEKQLIFAPHAVDNKRFAENRQEEATMLRNSLGINKEAILILFAGKLESKKNPELLLKAFMKIYERQATKNIHLLFIGNGVLENSLKSQSDSYRISNLNPMAIGSQIHFIDFQNQTQMPTVYQACNIFCLPSQGPNETWGLAINEAMAVGKAIIASNKVGCAVDLVKENINGTIFENNNINSLAAKLQHLVKDKQLLVQYGEQSKKIIAEWSFEKQVTALTQQLYEH